MQKELYADYHDFQIDFINNYPNSIAAYFVVVALVPEQDSKQYIMVGTELPKKYPNFEFLSELQEQVGFLVKAAEGTEAQDLVYPSPNGELIALSSLRGKYVLLDFWASWCRPCRAENPNLVKLYNKFKGDKFEIYGFSLDEDANKWTDAIDADGIKWVQTSELLGWKSKGVEMYGIQSIPTNYLLDPNGVIIAKNLVGEELEDKLNDIFGK
jgi:thiol-disulfide isomerase/thioredoxin